MFYDSVDAQGEQYWLARGYGKRHSAAILVGHGFRQQETSGQRSLLHHFGLHQLRALSASSPSASLNSVNLSPASLSVSYFLQKQKRINELPAPGSEKKLDPGTAAIPCLLIKWRTHCKSSANPKPEMSVMM